MHPPDCPGWEYDHLPHANQVLTEKTAELLTAIRFYTVAARDDACDSRPIHLDMYRPLAPPMHQYFAGHYRGENYRCLREYEVRVSSDPRVGFPSFVVLDSMRRFADLARNLLDQLDIRQQNDARARLIEQVVVVVAHLLEGFLRIHPYANGNGHMGRLIALLVLARYGVFPKRWTIHPRPPHPNYEIGLSEYRNGNRDILCRFIYGCLVP